MLTKRFKATYVKGTCHRVRKRGNGEKPSSLPSRHHSPFSLLSLDGSTPLGSVELRQTKRRSLRLSLRVSLCLSLRVSLRLSLRLSLHRFHPDRDIRRSLTPHRSVLPHSTDLPADWKLKPSIAQSSVRRFEGLPSSIVFESDAFVHGHTRETGTGYRRFNVSTESSAVDRYSNINTIRMICGTTAPSLWHIRQTCIEDVKS
ncbi:hypothetical protein F2Q69_00031457 [Brassica cretica]|uniref:Uncharacterized protein n=1 Tax=Brassica cretica TaxID=69181 RepID=A0A8S9RYJ8_BRACR|nr:hypothetical protein F2Q69_00031457 [Brassica cretica]